MRVSRIARVLHLDYASRNVFFTARNADDGTLGFAAAIPIEVWRSLGSPTEVTMTLEPGDVLS
jgi:hypothetical protein